MNLIEQLKIEETKLMEKISNTENEATYRNLIKNLAEVTNLRQREEDGKKWTQMYSKYETKSNDEDNFIPVVSVWEQKGDDVRNHRTFEIAKEIDNKEYEMYFEAEYRMNFKREPIFSECNIYFNEEIIKLSGNMEGISEYIINLTKDKKVKIYGEDIGDGYGLVYILKNKGIDVIGKKTKNERVYETEVNKI